MLDGAGHLAVDRALPAKPGVYAFVVGDSARYVGLATMGLAKRLRFYTRPGPTQSTSVRLNKVLTNHLAEGEAVTIFTAGPPALSWQGLPVSGEAGLELGLIQTFHLPWNIRGAR